MNDEDSSDSVLFLDENGEPIKPTKTIECITIDDDDDEEEDDAVQQLSANSEDSALGVENYGSPYAEMVNSDEDGMHDDDDANNHHEENHSGSSASNFEPGAAPPSRADCSLVVESVDLSDEGRNGGDSGPSTAVFPQRMTTTLLGTLSSSIAILTISPSASDKSTLPKTITPASTTDNNSHNVIHIAMSSELGSQSAAYHHNHSQAGEDRHPSGQEVAEGWPPKSNTAISSFLSKKSPSSSSSAASSCGSDFELLVHSPEEGDSHHDDHHDTSPDSPDSGVSGSVNSADDLKHMEDEEEEDDDEDDNEHMNLEPCATSESIEQSRLAGNAILPPPPSTSIEVSLPDEPSQEDLDNALSAQPECDSRVETSAADEMPVLENTLTEQINSSTDAIDTRSLVSQLTSTAKNNAIRSHISRSLKPDFVCKWHKCDWPGSYDELADHMHLHVSLQPFLDEHGKVIRWSKPKHKLRSANDDDGDDEDETPCNSEPEEDSDGEEDEDMQSDDDARSVSSTSSLRITRRSRRGLLDYSPHKNAPKLTRQNSQQTDLRSVSEKQTEQYVCLWKGCRVYGRLSSSKQWLERHVLELHSGPNPFKCIWAGCGLRFKSQNSLERHVNSHLRQGNMIQVAPGPPPGGSGRGQHSKNGNCCCSCSCHSCSDCDTETAMPGARPDKKRCESTDSAISLNSSSSSISECSPSTSHGLSTATLSSSTAPGDHCHTSCCCRQSSELGSNVFFYRGKKKHFRRKRALAPARRSDNFDFVGDEARTIALHRTRTETLSSIGIDSFYRKLERKANGRFVELPLEESEEEESEIDDDDDDEYESYDSDSDDESKQLPKVIKEPEKENPNIVYCLDERLFEVDKMVTFTSEVLFVHKQDNGEVNIRLRWNPPGIIDDQWIKETDLEANRTRSVPQSKLPKSLLAGLVSRQSVKRSQSTLDDSQRPNKLRKH